MGELCAAATLAGLTQRKFDARSPAFCHGLWLATHWRRCRL